MPLSAAVEEKRSRLMELLASYGSCLVAFSGGVDSTVLAKAAQLALGDRATAVTGASASLASGELDEARRLAAEIGIRHEIVETQEFQDPNYLANAPNRCYFCKTELYTQLEQIAAKHPGAVMVNGANADDTGEHRPGMMAASEHQIASPLLECGLNKEEVRALAADWGLPIWDKPATPCLSSRVAYGESVTPERLAMIDGGEQFLRQNGFRLLRVRYHKGGLARIEVPVEDLPRLLASPLREQLAARFAELGFKFVTIDLAGFRSGSLNTLVPVESLVVGGKPRG